MPCRCDDYYDRGPTIQSQLDSEHERRCHAQSLVNKLACLLEKKGVKIPAKLAQNIKACREDLVAHKREEYNKDVSLIETSRRVLENKIKQIQGLGGIAPESMLQELSTIKTNLENMREITDAELLGDETT